MASKKPSMIDALRAKHDPHYQLAGKVESLGKDIPIQLAQLHKTLSKSFAMQRKTLTRVLGLEKKVAELEEERAVEEQAKKGIDDILGDIRGEEDEEFDAAHATPEEVEEYNSSVPMTDEEKEFVGEESKFDAQDKSVSTKTKPKKKKPKI